MNKSDDTISRRDAIEAIASRDETDGTVEVFTGRQVNEILESLPSAEVKAESATIHNNGITFSYRKTGKWIVNISDYESVCSVCGAKETDFIYGTEMWYGLGESNYCPNCGAKMRGEEE